MSNVRQIDIEMKRMDLFCKKRGWNLVRVEENPKNKNQFLVECLDESGMTIYILIGSNGYLWRWIGPKKWEEVKF